MTKRTISLLSLGSLALMVMLVALDVPAQSTNKEEKPVGPPVTTSKEAAGNKEKDHGLAHADKDNSAAVQPIKSAASRISAVTVYQNSALITREVDVPAGTGPIELVVTPLPPTTINSSLYTEGTEGIRVLTTRFRSRPVFADIRADVRKLQDELRQLQLNKEKFDGDIKAALANSMLLQKMENFTTVTNVQGGDKVVLNAESAIAMSKHIRESRLETTRELVKLQQDLQANQESAEFVQRQLKDLAAGTVRTDRDAVISVERIQAAGGKIRLNYHVDAASWRPQYKLHAGKTAKDAVQLEYLAAVVQHSGEDWSKVRLTLSTAQPMLNATPPELQVLKVAAVPEGTGPATQNTDVMALEEQVKILRDKAQKDFNTRKQASGIGLVNTAAALDQSFELFNPEAALKRGCSLAIREGPTVTYHLNNVLSVSSRPEEQMLEVTRLAMAPDYYYKALPLLSTHVYRMADMNNLSSYVLLPGEATMYIGSDFVGQMSMPLVAVGEQFTAGFGVDPQLQVHRQLTDKSRTTQGGNQSLRYEYRILVNSYKTEPVKIQVWDRLPHSPNDAVGVNLMKTSLELSKDVLYLREQRPNNLLRWDVEVDGKKNGEKALAINYEFKLEFDRRLTISSFQTAGVFGVSEPAGQPASGRMAALDLTPGEMNAIKAAMAKLSPDDRRMAEAQVFCAVDQGSPLGTTGPIFKEVISGQPVFLCCKGCVAEARAHPAETLASMRNMMAKNAKAGGKK